jgi:hypothetical protein
VRGDAAHGSREREEEDVWWREKREGRSEPFTLDLMVHKYSCKGCLYFTWVRDTHFLFLWYNRIHNISAISKYLVIKFMCVLRCIFFVLPR